MAYVHETLLRQRGSSIGCRKSCESWRLRSARYQLRPHPFFCTCPCWATRRLGTDTDRCGIPAVAFSCDRLVETEARSPPGPLFCPALRWNFSRQPGPAFLLVPVAAEVGVLPAGGTRPLVFCRAVSRIRPSNNQTSSHSDPSRLVGIGALFTGVEKELLRSKDLALSGRQRSHREGFKPVGKYFPGAHWPRGIQDWALYL